jgi:hypothetical protein
VNHLFGLTVAFLYIVEIGVKVEAEELALTVVIGHRGPVLESPEGEVVFVFTNMFSVENAMKLFIFVTFLEE